MTDVPDSPEGFFETYVPARFAEIEEQLSGKSSAGCISFRVGEDIWSLRLQGGQLVQSRELEDDVLVQVTMAAADFGPIVVQSARQQDEAELKPEGQIAAYKAMTIDEPTAELVRRVAGTIVLAIQDDEDVRRLAVTPGNREPNLDTPECLIEVRMSDLLEMQENQSNPMQLMMSGKLKIQGNMQLPMALMGIFA